MSERKELITCLSSLLRTLADELDQNPALAERLIFNRNADKSTRPLASQVLAKFDAIEILRQGGAATLRQELHRLELPELKTLLTKHALDTTRLAQKWRSKDRLVEFIVERMTARSQKGDAFRENP